MATTKFRRVRGKSGEYLTGLYESDICRVERDVDGLWVAEVPMRRIGNSGYMEFRSLGLGGQWARIGKYRVRAGAMVAAQKLQSGECVYDTAVSRNGDTPIRLVPFSWAAEEIRKYQ